MIRVLQDWNEIGRARLALSRKGLAGHGTAEKCWDLAQLHDLVESRSRSDHVVDLGCGDLYAVRMLHALGFTAVTGVDRSISLYQRLRQGKVMFRTGALRRPFRLVRGDITQGIFAPGSIDFASCISTIEHGVEPAALFGQVAAMLRPGGIFFLTTDYWDHDLGVREESSAYGLPWRVFSRTDVMAMIATAASVGLTSLEAPCEAQLACTDHCVRWNGAEYTFVSVVFQRDEEERGRAGVRS